MCRTQRFVFVETGDMYGNTPVLINWI